MRIQKDQRIAYLEDQFEQLRNTSQIKIDQQQVEINTLTTKVRELTTIIISLKEVITKKEDVEAQLASAHLTIENLEERHAKIRSELEQASDYILSLEEKVYKANKTSLELLK